MSEKTGGTALYRRYRSQNFGDVVGQEHVTKTLMSAVSSNRLSHAYLFVGPRGVGKTSVARILAHAASGLKYDGQSNHLDIIEIDAASNRGIDEIRDLRDKVHLAPSSAKYKVYIIDDVHMLTAPAFSALLKTLEEPPSHVIFIMATTEGHKIPATIVSRAQRFAFLPLGVSTIEKHLADVAKQEKINVEPKALHLMAQYGFGSLRDALGLLDQLAHLESIEASDAEQLIGLAPEEVVNDLMEALRTGSSQAISDIVDEARTKGVSPAITARQLIDEIRKSRPLNQADVALYDDLLEVAMAPDPELKLEAVLLRHCLMADSSAPDKQEGNIAPAGKPPKKETVQSEETRKIAKPASEDLDLSDQHWQQILKGVRSGRNSLYAVLRQANPSTEDGSLMLEFKFSFHKNRAGEDKNKKIIEQVASEVLSRPIRIKIRVNPDMKEPVASGSRPAEVSSVIDLMGGGDVMEYNNGK